MLPPASSAARTSSSTHRSRPVDSSGPGPLPTADSLGKSVGSALTGGAGPFRAPRSSHVQLDGAGTFAPGGRSMPATPPIAASLRQGGSNLIPSGLFSSARGAEGFSLFLSGLAGDGTGTSDAPAPRERRLSVGATPSQHQPAFPSSANALAPFSGLPVASSGGGQHGPWGAFGPRMGGGAGRASIPVTDGNRFLPPSAVLGAAAQRNRHSSGAGHHTSAASTGNSRAGSVIDQRAEAFSGSFQGAGTPDYHDGAHSSKARSRRTSIADAAAQAATAAVKLVRGIFRSKSRKVRIAPEGGARRGVRWSNDQNAAEEEASHRNGQAGGGGDSRGSDEHDHDPEAGYAEGDADLENPDGTPPWDRDAHHHHHPTRGDTSRLSDDGVSGPPVRRTTTRSRGLCVFIGTGEPLTALRALPLAACARHGKLHALGS